MSSSERRCSGLAPMQPTSSDAATATQTRMYEAGYSTYPMDYDISHPNFVGQWSTTPYAVISWGGHGAPTAAHRYYYGAGPYIEATDCSVLDDRYPSIVFADSCYTSMPPSNNTQ